MKVSYFREMRNHHLVVTAGEAQCPEYQIKMIQQNSMHGLLRPTMRMLDGQTEYDYLITGCQSLQTFVEEEPIPGSLLSQLTEALCRALEELERYMMDGDYLALRPEFIYLERDKGEVVRVKYCIFPFQAAQFEEQLRELLKFILNEVDYQEKQAVDLAYELFHEVSQDPVNLSKLRELAQALETEKQTRKELPESSGKKRETQITYVAEKKETDCPIPVQSDEILWMDERREDRWEDRRKKPALPNWRRQERKIEKEREIALPVYRKKSILEIIKTGGN